MGCSPNCLSCTSTHHSHLPWLKFTMKSILFNAKPLFLPLFFFPFLLGLWHWRGCQVWFEAVVELPFGFKQQRYPCHHWLYTKSLFSCGYGGSDVWDDACSVQRSPPFFKRYVLAEWKWQIMRPACCGICVEWQVHFPKTGHLMFFYVAFISLPSPFRKLKGLRSSVIIVGPPGAFSARQLNSFMARQKLLRARPERMQTNQHTKWILYVPFLWPPSLHWEGNDPFCSSATPSDSCVQKFLNLLKPLQIMFTPARQSLPALWNIYVPCRMSLSLSSALM